MHALTLNQNLTRVITKGKKLLMWIPMPFFPLQRSRRRNKKIQRRRSVSSTPRCGKGFFVDNGSQKNLISADVTKHLGFPTTLHPQPYTIEWLHQGWDLRVSQQCRLPHSIKPFTDEVLCEISPLDVCDVLLGQPYLWNIHVVYESKPKFVIVNLENKLNRILEIAP